MGKGGQSCTIRSQYLFLLLTILQSATSKLTISKDCGDIVCESHSFCSRIDHSCRSCQIPCDPSLGNYDQNICETDCQDYLHDLWYMRKSENDSIGRGEYIDVCYKVQQDLRLLKVLIGIVIILSTVVMLALFGIMIYFKRLRRKLQLEGNPHPKSKKIGDLPVIYSNSRVLSLPFPDIHKGPSSHISSSINNNMSRSSSPDLVSRTATYKSRDKNNSFIMENRSARAALSLKEKQKQLRKEPSESTLPEYSAYDNPALVPSPVHAHM